METALPPIPAKRYFTIGEVSEFCGVKPHVLRYWEQEFTQLRPMKRRGNRRYYQHHEVLMIRRIRELLYDQKFTISGARNRLQELAQTERDQPLLSLQEQDEKPVTSDIGSKSQAVHQASPVDTLKTSSVQTTTDATVTLFHLRSELLAIHTLLRASDKSA